MHKKSKINQKKIKGGCQSGKKVVTHDSKSDLPLVIMSLALQVPRGIVHPTFWEPKKIVKLDQ